MLKKQISIALLINEVEGDFNEVLFNGINDAAKHFGVNLIAMVGKSLNSPDKYERNNNVAYDLINYYKFDGAIVSSGTMAKYIDENQLFTFIDKIEVPTVSISVPYGYYCSIDNKTGLRELINHMIRIHKKRKIAFITGPEFHSESIERLQVYIDTLRENDIQFNEDLLIHGNFTLNSATNAVRDFLKNGIEFDTIVASNDEMAIGAIMVLEEYGIKVPEQIAVTGFDNIPSSSLSSLTTVRQPIYELGFNSLELLIDIIENKQEKLRVLGTQLIIRESCGCKLEGVFKGETILSKDFKNKAIADKTITMAKEMLKSVYTNDFEKFVHSIINYLCNREKSTTVYQEFIKVIDILNEEEYFLLNSIIKELKTAVLLNNFNDDIVEKIFFDLSNILIERLSQKSAIRNRNVLDSINNLRQVLLYILISADDLQHHERYVTDKFKEIGMGNYFVYVYENSSISKKKFVGKRRVDRQRLRLILSNTKCSKNTFGFVEIFQNILNDGIKTYMVFPIFFQDEQFGWVFFEYSSKVYNISIFETVAVYFSSAIKISSTLSSRKRIENKLKLALSELESYNEMLNYLSFTDELTGLYNRRGFSNFAEKCIEVYMCKKKTGYLFYADMDGLKKINDTYGHEEGDIAIRAMAGILEKTFRNNDIIARLAGDEFTILSIGDNGFDEKKIIERLKMIVNDHNKDSEKPYEISISIGAVKFKTNDESVNIDYLLNEADSSLYKQKREKHSKRSGSE